MSDPAFSGSNASGGGTNEDQDDAASSIVVTTIKQAQITQLQLVTGIVLTVLSGLVMCYVLMEIQRQHYTRLTSYIVEDADNSSNGGGNPNARGGGGNELELEESSHDNNMTTVDISAPNSKAKSYLSGVAGSVGGRRSLPWYTKLYIIAQVGVLILLNYLLLVFLPASISLSLLAAFLVWVMVLHQVILDETCRRHRADRVLAVLGCFLVVAASLSLATFARKTQEEGTIYKGPARIIGYDMDQYSNHGKEAIRADLLVSFGGEWACPENPTECQAKVRGVLCHDKFQDTDGTRRHRRRQLLPQKPSLHGQQRRAEEDVEEKGGEKDVDDLMKENSQLENEVENVTATNAELNQDLQEEEDANQQLNETLGDEMDKDGIGSGEFDDYVDYGNYTFDDWNYDDGYWTSYDWSTLWGEYACGDLFNQDMDAFGANYDYLQVPGNDSWPYVTIYGSCNSCDAYLVDFFSTEHFAEIQTFLVHSRYYGVAAAFVGFLALVAGIQQRFMRAAQEKEIELLECDDTTRSSAASERPFVSA